MAAGPMTETPPDAGGGRPGPRSPSPQPANPLRAYSPSRLELLLLVLLGLAALAGGVAGELRDRPTARYEDLLAAAREGYDALWREIDGVAAAAARRVGALDPAAASDLELFDSVAAALPARGDRDWTLYLVGPLGRLRAWSGAGLLHPVEPPLLPQPGRAHRSSLTAATLLAAAALEGQPGWRVVAGVSLATDSLPFRLPGDAHLGTPWGLTAAGETGAGGRAAILRADTPTLLIDEARLAEGPKQGARPWFLGPFPWLGAWLLLAATAFRRRLGGAAGLLLVVGFVCLGRAAGAGPGLLAALAAATLAALGSAAAARRRSRVALGPVRGVAGAAVLLALAWALQRPAPVDLVAHFLMPGPAGVQRAVLFLAALAWLGLLVQHAAAGVPRPGKDGGAGLWLAALALTAAAAATDLPWVAAALVLASGGVLGRALAGVPLRRRPLVLAGLALTGALAAATANEIAYRAVLRRELGGPTLAALAPPTPAETAAERRELGDHFERFDLADLSAADLGELDHTDLAFQLWRQSPLARRRAISAVQLRGDGGESHLFSFGIPVDAAGRPLVQSRERIFDRPVWDYALVNETAPLLLGRERWGEVEYWLLVRPGHRLAPGDLADVSLDLLRGGPSGRGAVQDLVQPASYALYRNAQQARISPWTEPPALPAGALPPDRRTSGRGRVVTPDGPSWLWTAAEPDGIRALSLSRLGPVESFERAGRHTLGSLWPLAALAGIVFLLRLSRGEFRDRIRDLWRSYSRRLVLVFSFLVMVPVVVVDVLVLRVLSERLEEEQLAEARRALGSAQRVLGEYASAQQSGMGIDTLLDDDLMSWLSQVLDHEVNLYWLPSGEVSASSRQELFAAGLLPRRIPGEVYSALRLRGRRLAARQVRTGTTEYTELYAPLALPGEDPQSARFLISIPLLAQEAAVAAEIEGLRHQVALATALLVVLLVALGARLAASFTTPLEELVEGTRRIAGGAERLGLEPREQELATLVEAIDRMAQRIADGRRELMLEKRVVERMVDNITAAVVSVDDGHRVIMQNEVAGRLLGTAVGESLETALARDETLGKVLEGLRRSELGGGPQTIALPGDEEGETREWSLVWVPIPGEGEPRALVVVEDVTEVVRGQRLQAWAEMARIIAHEIKNPLTPIRLSAEHMRELHERDPAGLERVFDQCVGNILRHVEELRVIATEFSTYSHIPRIDPAVGDLTREVRELVSGYRLSPPPGVEIELEAPPEPILVAFDGRLLMRALRNLLENALRAAAGGGTVRVELLPERGGAAILVADTGPGVAADQLSKIFDPYFSTHDTGTGLGLPIARRIIEEHGGEIQARNRRGGGLEVRVTLPAVPAAGSTAPRSVR